MDASSTASLAPLSGGKSKVWRFFGFQVDDKGQQLNKKEVFCRVCKGRLPYSGNTTNLLYHLQTCHEEDYKTVSSSSSSSSTSSLSSNYPYFICRKCQTVHKKFLPVQEV